MKKLCISMICAITTLVGCTVNSTPLPNQQSEITSISQLPEQYKSIPVMTAPEGVKDGAFSGKASNGRTFKAIVRNGIIDDYFDVYHPNGKLYTHTILKNGLAEGWSEGYTEDGKLRSKILYKNGKAIEMQRYDEQGKLIKSIQ